MKDENIYLIKDLFPSTPKVIGLEMVFFMLLPVWVGVSIVDLVALGPIGFLVNKAKGERGYYPPLLTKEIWRMIWKHLRYLFRCVFRPKLVAAEEAAKKAAYAKLKQARNVAGGALNAVADFGDAVDVASFFALLPHVLSIGYLLLNIVAGIILCFGSVVVYRYEAVVVPPAKPVEQPEVKFVPQVADLQDQNFGPWLDRSQVLSRVASLSFKRIAFLSNTGQIQYSKTKTGVVEGFTKTPFQERIISSRLLPSGQVEFRDQFKNIFVVNPGQIFLFEGYASKAFVWNEAGELFTIPQTNLKTLEVK